MAKKLTVEFIRSEFAKDGYKLLTIEYINSNQKLDYICPKGTRGSISWNNWQQGRRCACCVGNKKLTIEFIRSEFAKNGYKLLTTKYINNKQKLDYICPRGIKHNISWHNWQRGQRCPCCVGNKKLTIEFIRSEFAKDGYKLLTTKYINNKQKLDYICNEGHRHSISWGNWITGYRCPTCFFIKNSGVNHPNWQGGVSCEPYCDAWADKSFKEDIKLRDNYVCQNPDCRQTTGKLSVHHIDYDKRNCHPSNLITLCISCNSRANFDREHWKKLYKTVVNEKYIEKNL